MADLDLLGLLQDSARKGTLLSSCEPEIKELMHQLDILISAKCGKLEMRIARVNSLLEKKEDEVELLRGILAQRNAEIEQLKCAANSQDRSHHAHSADCEAQLVRLRSEVTRISQSYEQLKEKRYNQRGKKLHHIERNFDLSQETMAELETEQVRYKRTQSGRIKEVECSSIEMLEEAGVDNVYTMKAQESSHFLEELFDKHTLQLNHEMLKLFETN